MGRRRHCPPVSRCLHIQLTSTGWNKHANVITLFVSACRAISKFNSYEPSWSQKSTNALCRSIQGLKESIISFLCLWVANHWCTTPSRDDWRFYGLNGTRLSSCDAQSIVTTIQRLPRVQEMGTNAYNRTNLDISSNGVYNG